MPNRTQIVHCNINKILKEQGKTKVWLAEKCKLTKQHVGDIANGKRKGIHLIVASKIAKALNKNIDKVFIIS